MKQTHLLVVIIAIVIIAGGWWYLDTKNKATAPENTQTEQTEPDPNQESPQPETPPQEGQATNQFSGNNALTISNQVAGDTSITVDNVNLEKSGFIVIYSGNQLIASSKLISGGVKQDLEILTRSTLLTNTKYTANLYIDDGDKTFDSTKDIKLTNDKAEVQFIAE